MPLKPSLFVANQDRVRRCPNALSVNVSVVLDKGVLLQDTGHSRLEAAPVLESLLVLLQRFVGLAVLIV